MMAKHKSYTTVKKLIGFGDIHSIEEILENIPKSVVARDLGMNYNRINKLSDKVDLFVVKEVFRLADLLEVDKRILLTLICNQYDQRKKAKK
ncbi:MAG TPA: hypothetical protein VK563_01810 [Puia sp.]|nr:hypothetical protein [Puia sp.]